MFANVKWILYRRCAASTVGVVLALLLCFAFAVYIASCRHNSFAFRPQQLPRHNCSRTKRPFSSTHNFRRLNTPIADYDTNVSSRLAGLARRRATAADPGLIQLIRDMMDPPSRHMVKASGVQWIRDTPQSREVDQVFDKKVISTLCPLSFFCTDFVKFWPISIPFDRNVD